MPRLERPELPTTDRRRGPYETSYDVLRGYEAPPSPSRRASDRAPALVAARRETRDHAGPYDGLETRRWNGTKSAFAD